MKGSVKLFYFCILIPVFIISCFNENRDNPNDPFNDKIPPVPGNNGTISFTDFRSTSFTVNWSKASDNLTPPEELLYQVVLSTSDNIRTISDAEKNGTIVRNWGKDISSCNITNLTFGTEYYINIFVKDQGNTIAPYTGSSQKPIPEEIIKIIAGDGAGGDLFGNSVSISSDGSTMAVGAYLSDNGMMSNTGSVYIFEKPADGWEKISSYMAKLRGGTLYFGQSVSMSSDGSIVAIGSHTDVGNSGAAYVYVRPGTGWADTSSNDAQLLGPGGAQDYFGRSISISADGSTVVVGAFGVNSNQGAAYVYVKPGGGWSGNLSYGARLLDSSGGNDYYFGESVSMNNDGSVIVAGESAYNSNRGRAFLFKRPGSGWTGAGDVNEFITLRSSDEQDNDNFGKVVSISSDGSLTAISATDKSKGKGAIFLFDSQDISTPGTLYSNCMLCASDGLDADSLGSSLAISSDGSTIISRAVEKQTGSTYIYRKPVSGWSNDQIYYEHAKVHPSGGLGSSPERGNSISIYESSGKIFYAVGISGDDIGSNNDQGSLSLFVIE